MATAQRERYRRIQRLGAGGMGAVFLAEDTVLGRRVALKRLHLAGDPGNTARFRREAKLGASLSHPNVVSVYDVIAEDDELVVVMEYVEGETLRDELKRGRLDSARACEVIGAVAAGLDHAHERGVIHRDIKPGNILLGPGGTVKLADLGLATAGDRTRITTSGAVMGTIAYMAPEQLEGERPTKAVDVYALAALAYEALTGRGARPHGNPVALARAIAAEPAPDLRTAWPKAPPAAAEAIKRGLDRDPAKRQGSAGELAMQLGGALREARSSPPRRRPAPPPPRRRPAPPPSRRPARPADPLPSARRRGLPALVGLLAAAVAVAVMLVLASGDSSPDRVGTTAAKKPAPRPSHTNTTNEAGQSAAPVATGGQPSGATIAPADGSTPEGAVRAFYTRAAAHDYDGAWELAGPGLRSQLLGRDAFENQFSTVRSIDFEQISTSSRSGDRATVALRTTAVHTDRTDRCRGTADAVRSGTTWAIDHISVSC
jgi:serine/threonine protein kinase